MKISKRTKRLAIFIFGWNIGIYIAVLIFKADLYFALLMGISGIIVPIILYILGVDKNIKDYKTN